MSYATAILQPASRKIVFAVATFIKHFYAWTASGTPGIWYQAAVEPVIELNEDDAAGTECASWAALVAQSVASVGAWWWDASTERLYYKALTATDSFEHFVVGKIRFRFAEYGVEDDSGNPYEPKILSAPPVTLSISEVFESKAGQIGSGTLALETADGLFFRTDIELDGDIELFEAIET